MSDWHTNKTLRCVLVPDHSGTHVYNTRKPIGDRYADGEFRGRVLRIPGVTVPANEGRCDARKRNASYQERKP